MTRRRTMTIDAPSRGNRRWGRRRRRQEVMVVLLLEIGVRIRILVPYGCVYSSATLAAAVRRRWGGGVPKGAAVPGAMWFAVKPKGFRQGALQTEIHILKCAP